MNPLLLTLLSACGGPAESPAPLSPGNAEPAEEGPVASAGPAGPMMAAAESSSGSLHIWTPTAYSGLSRKGGCSYQRTPTELVCTGGDDEVYEAVDFDGARFSFIPTVELSDVERLPLPEGWGYAYKSMELQLTRSGLQPSTWGRIGTFEVVNAWMIEGEYDRTPAVPRLPKDHPLEQASDAKPAPFRSPAGEERQRYLRMFDAGGLPPTDMWVADLDGDGDDDVLGWRFGGVHDYEVSVDVLQRRKNGWAYLSEGTLRAKPDSLILVDGKPYVVARAPNGEADAFHWSGRSFTKF